MRPFREPVPVRPFLDWVDQRVALTENDHPIQTVVAQLGWTDDTGMRYLHRLRHDSATGLAERARLEDALNHAGVQWWEVYGADDADADAGRAWCPYCAEDVVTVESRCAWCDRETIPSRPAPPPRRRGVRPKLDDATLTKLHRVHIERGASVLEIARRIYERAGFKNARSAHRSILKGWDHLGLRARGRIEQTVLSSTKHGMTRRGASRAGYGAYKRHVLQGKEDRPQCAGVRSQAPRKGQRCQALAMEGSDYCFAHDPARTLERTAIVARMRKLRAARPTLPAEPFIAWLQALHAERGSWRSVGILLGVDTSLVARYGRGHSGRSPLERIGVEVVDRYAARAGTTTDAIYGTALRDLAA